MMDGAKAMPMAGMTHHAPHSTNGHPQSAGDDCPCIAACCHSMAAVVSPRIGVAIATFTEAPRSPWPVIEARDTAARLLDRLPESTAPPLA